MAGSVRGNAAKTEIPSGGWEESVWFGRSKRGLVNEIGALLSLLSQAYNPEIRLNVGYPA